ncbi:unnamed protein product, partial [Symbiodinium sp. CCMP2456]
ELRTEISEQLVPALLPHRCPVFPRSRWTGADRAVDWVLLLALCFDLLSEVVPRWADMPAEPQQADAQAARAASDSASWDDFCLELVNVDAQPAQQAQPVQEPVDDEEQGPDPTAAMDWSEFNYAMKKKAGHFARMRPGGVLALFRPCLKACMEAVYHAFWVSSDSFDHFQMTGSSNVRCYKILEELAGKSSLRFFDQIKTVMSSIPILPKSFYTSNMRTLQFAMASRCGSSHYQLLERFRYPTQLFAALLGSSTLHDAPECMLDELSYKFRKKYTRSELLKPEAQACLHGIATMWDLDICAIEARHASIRRFVNLFSNQTTGPDLPFVSAKFVLQQQSLQNLAFASSQMQQQSRVGRKARARKKTKKTVPVAKDRPRKPKRRQPGGAWNAFQHVRSMGVRCNKEIGRRLSLEYKSLSDADASYFRELGRAAKIAGISGFRPFPQAQRVRSQAVAVLPAQDASGLKDALVALQSQLRVESANRTQKQRQLQDSVCEMSRFDFQPASTGALLRDSLALQKTDEEQFKWCKSGLATVHW